MPSYTSYPKIRGFAPQRLGLVILCPYTSHQENVEALSQKQRIQTLYGCTYLLSYGYYEAFGAMWRYKAKQLAEYAYLLYQKGSPSHLTARTIMEKRQLKDTGFPNWWGDPKIHESHQEYMKEGDSSKLVFTMSLPIIMRPF